jgi:hypothetical protein
MFAVKTFAVRYVMASTLPATPVKRSTVVRLAVAIPFMIHSRTKRIVSLTVTERWFKQVSKSFNVGVTIHKKLKLEKRIGQ